MERPDPLAKDFWDRPLVELLESLQATPAGLTSDEAKRRLRLHGPNSFVQESRFTVLFGFFRLFANPLVIILVLASTLSLVLGDRVGGLIIISIVLLSVLLNFFMEFQARHAVEHIRKQVATNATVIRDGHEQELPIAELVPGDIIRLCAGDLVPADARLLKLTDLHVRESALTGESMPVEKSTGDLPLGRSMGLPMLATAFSWAPRFRAGWEPRSSFVPAEIPPSERLPGAWPCGPGDRIRPRHTALRADDHRITMLLVLFVLLVNIILHRPLLESFLFSVALAVGMTPEMMPMIITVTLAQGARRMTKKKVLVKQLAAIEDFGSVDILCSDKTGTLTEGEIVLDRHVDVEGKQDENVLRMIYLNSYFEAGIKSPLDAAILEHEHPSVTEYEKVDETAVAAVGRTAVGVPVAGLPPHPRRRPDGRPGGTLPPARIPGSASTWPPRRTAGSCSTWWPTGTANSA